MVFYQYEMSNIGSIEAFAVLDKNFRPDEVRHGRDFNFIVKESGGLRLFEPIVGNGRNKIGGSEYQVDIKLCLEDLRNPALVGNLRLVSQ